MALQIAELCEVFRFPSPPQNPSGSRRQWRSFTPPPSLPSSSSSWPPDSAFLATPSPLTVLQIGGSSSWSTTLLSGPPTPDSSPPSGPEGTSPTSSSPMTRLSRAPPVRAVPLRRPHPLLTVRPTFWWIAGPSGGSGFR
ncbi:unnamed protein product [Musa acuminata subsp. malaccensis]|uniref:(wild Malaysian banana) hypothetical protein n=1 Tax=Musa acuminata subsp. malaccensis TaxID=214687 RepID=A0A804HUN2_MUSAM|nr:unnamed protein product [Musa acuminata subsp. malaccensis]